jgi:hypothetical protein
MTTSLPVAFATKYQQGSEMQDLSLGPMSLMVPEKFSNEKSSIWVALLGSGFAGMDGRVEVYNEGSTKRLGGTMSQPSYLLVKIATEIPVGKQNRK